MMIAPYKEAIMKVAASRRTMLTTVGVALTALILTCSWIVLAQERQRDMALQARTQVVNDALVRLEQTLNEVVTSSSDPSSGQILDEWLFLEESHTALVQPLGVAPDWHVVGEFLTFVQDPDKSVTVRCIARRALPALADWRRQAANLVAHPTNRAVRDYLGVSSASIQIIGAYHTCD